MLKVRDLGINGIPVPMPARNIGWSAAGLPSDTDPKDSPPANPTCGTNSGNPFRRDIGKHPSDSDPKDPPTNPVCGTNSSNPRPVGDPTNPTCGTNSGNPTRPGGDPVSNPSCGVNSNKPGHHRDKDSVPMPGCVQTPAPGGRKAKSVYPIDPNAIAQIRQQLNALRI